MKKKQLVETGLIYDIPFVFIKKSVILDGFKRFIKFDLPLKST